MTLVRQFMESLMACKVPTFIPNKETVQEQVGVAMCSVSVKQFAQIIEVRPFDVIEQIGLTTELKNYSTLIQWA